MTNRGRYLTAAALLAAGTALYAIGSAGDDTIAAPDGWTTHSDPAGYTVNLPDGWQARGGPDGAVRITGTGGERGIIWPAFVPERVSSQGGTALLRQLAARAWPDASWQQPQAISASAARMAGAIGDDVVLASLVWVATEAGTATTMYSASAPAARYASLEQTFAQIAESFRAGDRADGGTAVRARAPQLSYTRWQDPRESAFSLEVPASWRTEGGLFRFASVDVRGAWVSTSPDGRSRISGGDQEIPLFAVPNQTLDFTGHPEGSSYSPGGGVTMRVRRYSDGLTFAREYVANRVVPGCAGLTFTSSRPRADAVAAINAIGAEFGAVGVSTTLDAGEVQFTCAMNGAPVEGYYFAATRKTEMQAFATWNVEHLYGFVASPSAAADAQAALEHALQTFQLNEQWANMQGNIASNTSRIVAETNDAISNSIRSSFENRQQSRDAVMQRGSDARRGIERVVDENGNRYTIESGASYNWIDNRGNVVGTSAHARPNADFRELVRLP